MTFAFRTLLLLALLLGRSYAAPAKTEEDGKAKAKTEYIEAMKSYNLNEYQPALDHFKEAYRAFPDASFLFNIAQCQRQLDQKAEAIKSYKSFLRNSTRSTNRTEVEAIIASLEKALAEEQAAKGAKPSGTLGPGETSVSEPTTTPPPVEPRPTGAPTPTVAPTTTPAPVVTTTTPAPTPTVTASAPPKKRTGLWIAVGVVVGVVVLGGIGAGVGIALSKTSYPSADVSGPTFRF